VFAERGRLMKKKKSFELNLGSAWKIFLAVLILVLGFIIIFFLVKYFISMQIKAYG